MEDEDQVISALEAVRTAYYNEIYEVDGLGVPTSIEMGIIKKADEAIEAVKVIFTGSSALIFDEKENHGR